MQLTIHIQYIKYINTVYRAAHLFGFHGELGTHTVCGRTLNWTSIESITRFPWHRICDHCIQKWEHTRQIRCLEAAIEDTLHQPNWAKHWTARYQADFGGMDLWSARRVLDRALEQGIYADPERWRGFGRLETSDLLGRLPRGGWCGPVSLDDLSWRDFQDAALAQEYW